MDDANACVALVFVLAALTTAAECLYVTVLNCDCEHFFTSHVAYLKRRMKLYDHTDIISRRLYWLVTAGDIAV